MCPNKDITSTDRQSLILLNPRKGIRLLRGFGTYRTNPFPVKSTFKCKHVPLLSRSEQSEMLLGACTQVKLSLVVGEHECREHLSTQFDRPALAHNKTYSSCENTTTTTTSLTTGSCHSHLLQKKKLNWILSATHPHLFLQFWQQQLRSEKRCDSGTEKVEL